MVKGREFLIVGGGIIGLSVARELLLRFPRAQVTLLEKEHDIGFHQTRHNSGVIHSGIHYPPGSLKARGCREGVRFLNDFCDRHGIRRRVAGKLIVANRPHESSELHKLFEWGKASGIPGLRSISRAELRELEPSVSGTEALLVPEVALVDFLEVARALRKEFEGWGGKVSLHHEVKGIKKKGGQILLETERETFRGSFLINCAGLYADRVARLAGLKPPVRIVPFRGEYFCLNPEKAAPIRHLIYSVPEEGLPFLGVHLTPTLNGEVLIGPNAVLALAREAYQRGEMKLRDLWDTLSYPGFWKMASKHWKLGLYEAASSWLKPLYAASARHLLPSLTAKDLLPGSSGVRAQAVDSAGRLLTDFLTVKENDSIHLLNAPSPAATASLAIARSVVDLIPIP